MGAGTVDLNGSLNAALAYQGNGIVTLADSKTISGAITAVGGTKGTLTVEGTSALSGQVGDNVNSLAVVNAGYATKTATFNNVVYAQTMNVAGTGTINLNGAGTLGLAGALVYQANGLVNLADGRNIVGNVTNTSGSAAGTLELLGTSTVTGTIGATGAGALSKVEGGAAGKTATLDGNVFATTVNVSGGGAIALTSGHTITGAVTTTTGGTGTLTLLGVST
ncbi:MAG: hypothetical protein HQL18_04025, partial [Candidatus Omnitrophica bacterium]|nr:hypothetical protein [Candidatus Omnitrophota bacterium]